MIVLLGTNSEILWHFTGGPVWRASRQKQALNPKPAIDAYNALLSILTSSELRLGQYRELVKVKLPTGHDTEVIESAPVCCLAEIPLAHLGHHARRYGKFAVGFHRYAVIKRGFNPVFYTSERSRVLRSISTAFARVSTEGFWLLRKVIDDLDRQKHALLKLEFGFAEDEFGLARQHFAHFLAFVKTFEYDELRTVYAEREWRSVKSYRFNKSDIAMIVLPRRTARRSFMEPFVNDVLPRLKLPATIPIVPWEYLEESNARRRRPNSR